jgi:hypothetical protein
METVIKIISATLVGTSAMTAFSYYISSEFRKKFEEPRLLVYVMKLCKIELSYTTATMLAWVIHYILGLLFVLAYDVLWNCCFELNWISALVFGCVSGIIGIIGWIIIFSLPSKSPRVAYTSSFIQLFFAHLLLAAGAFSVYKLMEF